MLTVLSVALPFAPIGRGTAGGAEQILGALDRELSRAGHRSLVLAQEGSECEGTLLPSSPWNGAIDDAARMRQWRKHRRILEEALERFDVDLVHYHGIDFLGYAPHEGPPAVATLHLPPPWYPEAVFRLDHERFHLCCVSSSERRACPAVPAACGLVPNGVDLETFRPSSSQAEFTLALGRICPEKGFHHALDAARRAGVPLLLAGEVFLYPEHVSYFDESVRPRLDTERRFLGPVGLARKKLLLSRARALLAPSLVSETSSLVAMEALACGTPVIAFRSGALEEIVEHGRTGFLVSNEDEMADAIARLPEIDRASCRRSAERRFSERSMVERYLTLYREILAGEHSAS